MVTPNDINNQKKFNEEVNDGFNSFKDYTDILKSINQELGKQYSISAQTRKEYDSLVSISQKLSSQEEGITRLKDDQLKKLQEQAQTNVSNIRALADSLTIETAITEQEKALLAAKEANFAVEEEYLEKINQEILLRQKINDSLGVTGNVLKGINEIGGSFAKAFKLDKVAEDMEKFSEETIRANGSVSRLAVLGKGLTSAFKSAFSTLTDPSVIIVGAIKGFKEVDKANVNFQRQTGQSLNDFGTAIDASNTHFITMSDYIKTASELTKELGQNAAGIFKPEDLMEAAEMTEAMGMASKEAAQLAQFSKINGGNIKAQNEAIIEGVNASNKQNKTAVAAGDILKDVANTSEGIAVSYAGYPEKLGAAASAAKALGMDLGKVDSIANSLLNFEESISSELEAELLTGKNLNLEKARELALNNDLEGVAKELAQQGITSFEFSKMNRIQQEAQAKALGMSRDELGKMLLSQEMSNGLNEDALSAAQKQTLEQLKQEEASEKFSKSIEKIQQALSPIVGFFADVLSSVTGFLTQTYLIYPLLGVIATIYVAKMASGFKGMAGDLKDMLGSVKDISKNLFDKGKEFFGKGKDSPTEKLKETITGKGDKIKETITGAGDKTAELQDKTKETKGEGPGGFLKSLGDGLASIGKQFGNVVKGALALGITGVALGASFALSMMMIKDVDPVQMIAFAGSLSILGLTVALLGKVGSQVIQGALALGILAISLIPAAFAFSLLSGVDTDALIAFSIALPLLSLAAAGLGLIAPLIMAGSLAIGALGLSLIPAAMAFNMLGESNIEGLTQNLVSLASSAPGLFAVAASLGAISAGLASIAVTGLLALPVLGALTALGTVSGALGSIMGGGEEGGNNGDMAKVNANLERLIALVEKGGHVYLDGQKVGTTMALGNFKTQ
jgi:hypothetical protein